MDSELPENITTGKYSSTKSVDHVVEAMLLSWGG